MPVGPRSTARIASRADHRAMSRLVGSRALCVALIGLAPVACDRAPQTDPRFVSEWTRALYGTIRAERISPPIASRLLGYATTALYSGLAAVDTTLPSLADRLNGFPELPRRGRERHDAMLAAIAAERVVLDSLLVEALPTTRAAVTRLADSLEGSRVSAGIDEGVGARSAELGRRVGIAIVAWARSDGFDSTRGRPYTPPSGPGLWGNDAPGNTYAAQNVSGATQFVALDNPANLLRSRNAGDRALILNRPKRPGLATLPPINITGASEPYWAQVRPFVLRRWDECAAPAPPAYAIDSTSAFFAEARAVRETVSKLTPEQRAIALYWADNAGESGTPPGHWIAIASQIAARHDLTAGETAHLMVLTAVAQADAFIASWGYKYQHNSVRPRAYIRSVIDSTWEPLIPTPPFPEYPSGHSTQSSAAATVLTGVMGNVAFDDSSALTIGHEVRRFTSFTAAAEEAGMSRVYAGIHFPFGNTGGRTLGQCVGSKVLERFQIARRP
jgi:membrane-associated phospholipid phosphatase